MTKPYQQCDKCKILIDENDYITKVVEDDIPMLICKKCLTNLKSKYSQEY